MNEVINFKPTDNDACITEASIGVVGHVDHGKTSLVNALTGKWTSTYSEELKRGITIRLGYADAKFYYCENDKSYCATPKCQKCMGDAKFVRAVSFVDAPGHETLMATVLSGAALMDGALLVIAANEKCPRPQTAEHLKALDIAGIRKIIIVQNKVDAVDGKNAMKNYEEIKKFVKGTVAEDAPVIPVSTLYNSNIDVLIGAIEELIKTPPRNVDANPLFFVARSFDINRPGTAVEELKGGVIGGSLTRGIIEKGAEIEISPGTEDKGTYKPVKTRVAGIMQCNKEQEKAQPGGLVALETTLDPSLTRGDMLGGNLAGIPGRMPKSKNTVKFNYNLFDYVIGVGGEMKVPAIKTGDALLVTHAVEKTIGVVISGTQGKAEIKTRIPLCVEEGDKLALSRQVGGRWHLVGWGEVV